VSSFNYLDTSFCVRYGVSVLGQCSNGLGQIMHSHSASAHPALDHYYSALVH